MKLIKLILLLSLSSSFIYATNGANLIGMGAKSRAMGGVGIGIFHGSESVLANGALLTQMEGTEVSFGGTLFLPTIQANKTPTEAFVTSSSDTNMIPEVSMATKINEHWYAGVGVWGVAGMGTNYVIGKKSDVQLNNFGMSTNLQLLQIGFPIAFKIHSISLAFTPIVMYGNLTINYDPTSGQSTPPEVGLSQNVGGGFALGFLYDFEELEIEGLKFGLNYKSSIALDYKNQISRATQPFKGFGIDLSDTLSQPAELGIGTSYTYENHSIAFDIKDTFWSSAQGYGGFGWEDGIVYATGYQYKTENWSVRVGYNYGKSVVINLPNAKTSPKASALNVFNILGFPATAEQHLTFGGSYKVNNNFSVDIGVVYQTESELTVDSIALREPFRDPTFPEKITSTHQETSTTLQLVYNF